MLHGNNFEESNGLNVRPSHVIIGGRHSQPATHQEQFDIYHSLRKLNVGV